MGRETNPNILLRTKAYRGLSERGLADKQEYIDRLEYELEVVEDLDFAPYFLVMWDIARFAKESNILAGPGRGSGAGSLLLYCLKVTLADPIKYGLYFERFLNPSRVSPPDVDWDSEDKDRVAEYVKEKYGEDKVCKVGRFGFSRTKGAIRDIGRVLEVDEKTINDLANLVPPPVAGLWRTLEHECDIEPKLKDSKYKPIMDVVAKLWGCPRSYGVHAGGVAVAPTNITDFVPIHVTSDKSIVSQYDWRDLETAGLLKLDLLGLKTLRTIHRCVDLTGENIDIHNLEDGNKKTYQLIKEGNLDGVFQLGGSESIKQLTVAFSPEKIEDLSTCSALFRPGPLSSHMLDNIIAVRQGRKEPEYLHPSLKPILEETSGGIVYQEQVMKICTDICGYTLPEADMMRKILGKKLQDKMAAQKPKFIQGAIDAGWIQDVAEEQWQQLENYAEYLFNKSHSLAYGIVSYQTAYLKANYPVEFYAALLECEDKPEMVSQYAGSAKAMGIEILPPDINKSEFGNSVENGKIRLGLNNIKGMPSAAAEKIIEVRNI